MSTIGGHVTENAGGCLEPFLSSIASAVYIELLNKKGKVCFEERLCAYVVRALKDFSCVFV